jgi:hypothetical protein
LHTLASISARHLNLLFVLISIATMAYGAIAAPKLTEELPTFSYPLPGGQELVTFPIHGEASADVMEYLGKVFLSELEGELS